jgi:nucleoside-diphosphate-sugar epimerase
VCDVEVLGEAMLWAAASPSARNQAFNISNGDVFTWESIWPALAKFFNLPLPAGPIQPISLDQMMADKEPLWKSMQAKYGLKEIPFRDLALWKFGDFIFSCDYHSFADVNKLRRAGFHGQLLETTQNLVSRLQELRDLRIIP